MNGDGIYYPSRSSIFWSFNIGHAITIVLMVVSVIGLYFKVDMRLSNLEQMAAAASTRVERMDGEGTRGSQRGLLLDSELAKSNTLRIAKLEDVVSQLNPRVERIDVNLQWLTRNLGVQNPKLPPAVP